MGQLPCPSGYGSFPQLDVRREGGGETFCRELDARTCTGGLLSIEGRQTFDMYGNVLMATSAGLGTFLGSFQATLAHYGSIVASIIGVAMVVVAIYQIAKGLMSGGKGQTNWVMTIALLLIGGMLALASGWNTIGKFVKTGNNTLSSMAEGTVDSGGNAMTDPFANGAAPATP